MSKYDMFGKLTTHPEKREDLAVHFKWMVKIILQLDGVV